MMSVGKNIRTIRKERGLTQKELGKLLGVSQAAIGQFENANANLQFETVAKIAKALNTTPLILYEGLDIMERLEQQTKNLEYLIKPGEIEHELLNVFWKLNEKGERVALERLKELTEIPRYTQPDELPHE